MVVAAAEHELLVVLADPLADRVGAVKSNGVPATGSIAPVGISVASTGV